MAKNWKHAAGILWPVLVDAARHGRKPTYGELAPFVETTPRNVGKALGPLLYYCMDENLPSLTSIVVNNATGAPGQGFIARDDEDIGTAQERVFEYPWRLERNPFGGFDENDTTESLAETLLRDPRQSEVIYRKIRVRGPIQQIFRTALLTAYNSQCAICALSFEEALEAAHIVPWARATRGERISPRNGVLLCSTHHKLFDSGWIEISDRYQISHIDDDYNEKDYGLSDKAATVQFDGKRIKLPRNRRLWPAPASFRMRYEQDERNNHMEM